jgi:hypothetical protein
VQVYKRDPYIAQIYGIYQEVICIHENEDDGCELISHVMSLSKQGSVFLEDNSSDSEAIYEIEEEPERINRMG